MEEKRRMKFLSVAMRWVLLVLSALLPIELTQRPILPNYYTMWKLKAFLWETKIQIKKVYCWLISSPHQLSRSFHYDTTRNSLTNENTSDDDWNCFFSSSAVWSGGSRLPREARASSSFNIFFWFVFFCWNKNSTWIIFELTFFLHLRVARLFFSCLMIFKFFRTSVQRDIKYPSAS